MYPENTASAQGSGRLQKIAPWAALAVCLCLAVAVRAVAAPGATEIFGRAQAVNPGDDQQSKLTLLIQDSDGNSRRVVIKRLWKRYRNQGNIESKVLLFHEYPPESRGTAFMVWTYVDTSGTPADQWIYIPILRKVNKLPPQLEENIHGSDLRASDMDPRSPSLDRHTLLREEKIGAKNYYVIESTPRQSDKTYPYGKVVRWISTDDYLIDKVDYYDRDGKLLKKQTVAWKHVKNAWVWQKVVITNVQSGSQTTLDITDIQVNQGLRDSLFTERMMQQGANALK